jgi:hypothetical protein
VDVGEATDSGDEEEEEEEEEEAAEEVIGRRGASGRRGIDATARYSKGAKRSCA